MCPLAGSRPWGFSFLEEGPSEAAGSFSPPWEAQMAYCCFSQGSRESLEMGRAS